MKPVAIFRHASSEGPGYLATFLDANDIPWQLIRIDEGEPVPAAIHAYSGIALMGGPMSVNDDLPWIPAILTLIRDAMAANIPVLGHCLGGQLMSKALGAAVTQNPVKEIGWGTLTVSRHETARYWFGEIEEFNGFHWHGETFNLPGQAVHLLSSSYCKNQAYAIGKHLAFQCHIEMTPDMVQSWCEAGAEELSQSAASPAVQQAEAMFETLPLHCFFLNKVAARIYGQWVKGLVN